MLGSSVFVRRKVYGYVTQVSEHVQMRRVGGLYADTYLCSFSNTYDARAASVHR
jgi:hypothetical protein